MVPSPQIVSRLTESDAGLVSTQHAVVCVNQDFSDHQRIVQHKKIGRTAQHEVHKKGPRQVKNLRVVVKPTVKGELKMNRKNWKQKVAKFAFDLVANVTIVAMLNAGMSVAP